MGNYTRKQEVDFSDLNGKTIIKVDESRDSLSFLCSDGTFYEMYHRQDCCESVDIEDVCGSWDDIIGFEVVNAYESTRDNDDTYGLAMWTFYHLTTTRGTVTIRWHGESNGYYSVSVDFYKTEPVQPVQPVQKEQREIVVQSSSGEIYYRGNNLDDALKAYRKS